jgi:hypothetical protein
MFRDEQHTDVSLAEWEAFRKWGSPYLIEKFLDRSSANLPDWFVPLARGAATPSRYLLRRAGYGRNWRRPPGWGKAGSGSLFKEFRQECLVVVPSQPLWRIEREGSLKRPHCRVNLTLAHIFGSIPILARNVQSAICLAEFCILPGPLTTGLCWAEGCPDDVSGAVKYAQQRRINEAVAAGGLQSLVSLPSILSQQVWAGPRITRTL